MIEYKGYIARIEYDDSVSMLHGSVINSGPYSIANCEAEDLHSLRSELQTSIDEYLDSCKEDGVEPIKPFSGNIHLRLGTNLHHRITVAAIQSGVSTNAWIKQVLEQNVSR